MYVADSTTDTIVRIDPATNVPTSARPDLGSDGNIDALDVSADGLLIGSRSSVFRLDPVTLEVVSGASAPGYVVGVGQSADAILVLTEGGSLVEALIP